MADENTKSVAELAADIKADHAKAFDKVKEIAEDALGKAKAGEDVTRDLKEKADEALLKMNGLAEQISEFEQKLARAHDGGTPEHAKSLGERVVSSESFKAAFEKGTDFRGTAQFQAKATITSATSDTAGAVGAAVPDTRLSGVIAPPNRRMTIRDLITPGQMDGSTLEYVRETGFNNNAAAVAEGATKPQSDIKMELVNTSAKVIAHTAKASRQILDDAAWMRSYIDGRLRYGLAFKEEYQLLSGDGTGQNLLGIVPQATAYAAPSGASASTQYLDTMRLAMLQAVLAEYPATGHVMNPIDWTNVELLKDADGRYIIGNPQGTAAPTLWGLPVVATQAMQVDKFLTGAFMLGAQVFDRWQARVEIATENEDDFVKNLVTMLCEERLALAVYRPEAFIYGDFGNVA
ncbi:major capsid protein [Phaeobacter inhibens]|uniref:Major capsid protein n=1 Tax=Phaeobacter inhibens TaxID=221822 RepID=A0ABM6RDK3_9RHOB|nr:phage major capsid protein [Phaeobacter inhibens]AUQ49939.1 major capsid protein [Phaeobacter inhibens]AUQ94495.1 major capsid protein [Phaeobacter inhibens]AUR19744.1 major capsid protein [Phaeobacter inhibens]